MWSTIKDQKSNYSIPWNLGKDPLKRDERSTIKYNRIEYGVTMDLQKMSFIEAGESCLY